MLSCVRLPCRGHLVHPARRRGDRATASVVLSEKRLQEFMLAEINYFAGKTTEPVRLAQIFQASTPASAAALIHKQLPSHFATRIKHIEALPRWSFVPELVEVHRTLSDSFRNLRLLEQGTDLAPLTEVIRDLRERHKVIIPRLAAAMGLLRADGAVDEASANHWLDSFLLARISTEMLTTHYTLLIQDAGGCTGSHRGIVDTRCDPSAICRQAVANVGRDPMFGKVPMRVESHICSKSEKGIEFSFLPQYLLLLVEELLKNSATATLRHSARKDCALGPTSVFVGADDYQVMIEISDKGGGIPTGNESKIWSYSWSTSVEQELGGRDSDVERANSWADPLASLGIKQRLGMGLPLTRLYTQYLGGSLQLMSIPGVGVDTFMNLRRIDAEGL